MADALRRLEDQLKCLICLDTYTDPKLLQCKHVFCRDCLVGLAGRYPQGLPCPTCRRVTPIPPAGVAGLQHAFQTNSLLEILQEHKKVKQDILYCPQHRSRELELYCETCEELICPQCTIQQHNGHKYNLIDEVFEKHKQDIVTSLNPVEQQLKLAFQRLDARHREITDQQVALKMQILKSSQQLHEIIDSRKNILIKQLHDITQEKLSELASQRKQIEAAQVRVDAGRNMVKENLKTGSQGAVLRTKRALLDKVKDLTNSFQPDILEPNTEADMVFLSSHAAGEACLVNGLVSAPTLPDPSQCHTACNVADVATAAGNTSSILVLVNNFEGKPLDKKIETMRCKLVSELTGTRASCSVERRGQSQYEVSYQPTVKGRHQLHIKISDEHIRGSPFDMVVKMAVEKLGTAILTLNNLQAPRGVAVNQSGEMVVTEQDGHCVTVFSPMGSKLLSFGKQGSEQGRFEYPSGVAVDAEGNILVADYGNHRIQKFTAGGKFVSSVGSEGRGELQFKNVTDIAVNSSNHKVYVVDENHRVQVLNPDLTFSGTFGRSGRKKGEFICPCGVTCDGTGNVYVTDSGNYRIQVFTSTGKFLTKFEICGESGAEVCYPTGISVDADGRMYICESYRCCVSAFSSEGQYVRSFGRKGEREGQFRNPRGLAVDGSGIVYVCDSDNNRLQVF